MSRFWSLEQRGAVGMLTFCRPPSNWMSTAAMTELQLELEALADAWPEVAVVVLIGGIDGYFIAHADLDDLALMAAGGRPEGDLWSWYRSYRLLSSMPQPTVAAIDGQAWGGGLELALACTLRIGSERAHMGLPEVSVGILPGGGGTQRLPRVVGPAKAAELILTGRIVHAEEAAAMGLLNTVLPAEGFVDAAVEWCERIGRHPAAAISSAKRAVFEGSALPLDEGLKLEGRLFAELNDTEEAKALNAAFPRPSA